MTSNTFLFDVYSPRGERFPIQGSKFLNSFLSAQPNEGIDWRVVARPLPSDRCRFVLVERVAWNPIEFFVAFMYEVIDVDEWGRESTICHIALLTASEIGQELGGN